MVFPSTVLRIRFSLVCVSDLCDSPLLNSKKNCGPKLCVFKATPPSAKGVAHQINSVVPSRFRMASEESELNSSLQRSQSTPEPLFGQPDLELPNFGPRPHANGKPLKEGQKIVFVYHFKNFYVRDLNLKVLS